jgi:hypothetical protein
MVRICSAVSAHLFSSILYHVFQTHQPISPELLHKPSLAAQIALYIYALLYSDWPLADSS